MILKRVLITIFIFIVFVGLIFKWVTPYMIFAIGAYFTLLLGYSFRTTNKLVHARMMGLGIGMDIGLVLLLQLQRDAIGKAAEFSLAAPHQLHILFSTIALILYFPTLFLGFKLLTNPDSNQNLRRFHLPIAKTALLFRTLGFLFMFTLIFKK